LGDHKDLSLEIAGALGTEYFRRVSPSETWEYRRLYRGPFGKNGKRFRKAVDLTKEYRYYKAKEVYQNNMDGFSNKVQGKALYNMAILHEALGEYDRMVKKAQRADGILQSRKSAQYLEYAKERRNDERKLKQQMNKAEQVNPQDNR
jgi:tetratricopeptide (TPR) repeat protein